MKKRTVARLARELDTWIGNPSNREFVLEAPKQALMDYVNGKPGSPLAPIGSLVTSAWWHGQVGAQRVLAKDVGGWSDMLRSLYYLAWDERTLFAALDKKIARSINIKGIAYVILHGLLAHEDSMVDWFGKRLLLQLEKNDKTVNGWESAPLYPFAVKLYALWRKIPLDYSGRNVSAMGVYQDLLGVWESDQRFAKALVAACEYHVQQAFDDSTEDTQEFFSPLYTLFPIEILAIGRVRHEQGLPMPAIDHPLMQTKLAFPPDQMPKVKDELLDQVVAKVCKDYSIDEPWK